MDVFLGILLAITIWVLMGWAWGAMAALVHYYWGPAKVVNGDDALEFIGFTAMLGPLAFIVFLVFVFGAIKNIFMKGEEPYHLILYRTREHDKRDNR